MIEVIKDLPPEVETCEYHKDKAIAFIHFLSYGRSYYFPLTKESLKFLGIEQDNEGFILPASQLSGLDSMLRDFLWAMHLQIREEFGDDIISTLTRKVEHGFAKMFEAGITKEVRALVKIAMPDLSQSELKEGNIAEDYYHKIDISCPNCGKQKLESNLIDSVAWSGPDGCQMTSSLNSYGHGHPIIEAVLKKQLEIKTQV